MGRLLPDAPEGSELRRWTDEGMRLEPSHSNIVQWTSPNERFGLTVEVDDPVRGFLVQLNVDGRAEPIGRTIVDDDHLALQIAAEMAAAADDLEALADNPRTGPEMVYQEDIDEGLVEAPDEWGDDEDWQEELDEAFEKAEIRRSRATLTTKEIKGDDYYYLQWRDGDTVESQYVAPVNPS